MTEIDPNEVLFGSGVPSFKFENYGDTCQGIITALKASRQTDPKTGEQKVWPSGDPMYQVVATVQTQERDPSIEDDDGLRKVYIKGRSLTDATRDAVKAAGQKKLEIGALLTVTFAGEGPKERGLSAPKLYEVTYQKVGARQAPPVQAPAVTAAPQAVQDPAYTAWLAQQAADAKQVAQEVPLPAQTYAHADQAPDPLDALDIPEEAKAVIRQMQAPKQNA